MPRSASDLHAQHDITDLTWICSFSNRQVGAFGTNKWNQKAWRNLYWKWIELLPGQCHGKVVLQSQRKSMSALYSVYCFLNLAMRYQLTGVRTERLPELNFPLKLILST